jgi:erythronate-4-phosphate dehydrogenase
LLSHARRSGTALEGRTIGIVGVGQVGSRVAKTCEILGMNVLLNDPPRARREGSAPFVSLQEIREKSDIITFHVPLNLEGADRTYHMVDDNFLHDLKQPALVVNTCRGEVFDTRAVLEARLAGALEGMVIDCWENEPEIDLQLLKLADYATPHIAGYSRDGKANGTTVSVRAISRFFGLGIDDWEPAGIEAPANPVIELNGRGRGAEAVLADAVLATYEIAGDDRALRENPGSFEQLRGDYPVRREFGSYAIKPVDVEPGVLEKLEKLGFRVPAP